VAEVEHGPECPCPRCRGFQEGNAFALRHGSYSVLQLRPRAAELAAEIRATLPVPAARYELAIQAAGAAAAQYERAMGALLADDVAPTDFETLDRRAVRWAKLLFTALAQLGLTPLSASKLGLNVALGTDAATRALERHVDEFYGDKGGPAS
jgi:hypothetical protein